MNLNEIYTEVITEHNQSKHNKRVLKNPDFKNHGVNPSCGDDIELYVNFDGDVIKEMAYSGIGCAISQASASVMIDLLKDKTITQAEEIIRTYLKMITREIKDEKELEILEEAIAFKNISNMPARVKCAVLAWHTLLEVLKKKKTKY